MHKAKELSAFLKNAKMGDIFGDGRRDEKPAYLVKINDFYMSKYEVTQKEYKDIMGDKAVPSERKGDYLPVESLRWIDAIEFCNKKSKMEGMEACYTYDNVAGSQAKEAYGVDNTKCDFIASGYRLQTEAEWEYVAREEGKRIRFGNAKNSADSSKTNFLSLSEYKKEYSVTGNYRARIVEVGSFKPNTLGLYNMSGNVWEWRRDTYKNDYLRKVPKIIPKGQKTVSNVFYAAGRREALRK